MQNFGGKMLRQARVVAKRPDEWTSEQVAIVRKIAANGGRLVDVVAALDWQGSIFCAYKRARSLGIHIDGRGKAHRGIETTDPDYRRKAKNKNMGKGAE